MTTIRLHMGTSESLPPCMPTMKQASLRCDKAEVSPRYQSLSPIISISVPLPPLPCRPSVTSFLLLLTPPSLLPFCPYQAFLPQRCPLSSTQLSFHLHHHPHISGPGTSSKFFNASTLVAPSSSPHLKRSSSPLQHHASPQDSCSPSPMTDNTYCSHINPSSSQLSTHVESPYPSCFLSGHCFPSEHLNNQCPTRLRLVHQLLTAALGRIGSGTP